MANIQSAKKRARQTIVKNELKSAQRASVRTAIRSVEQAIEAKDKDKATNLFVKTQKLIDKMANKKVITKNSASRQKSRLNKNIKLIS
jgi:small subunit ribosomal protein S20|tara:strand:- start:358 stop:621 length:264 start_codon:yes stop_codon:yes gene_type:complete